MEANTALEIFSRMMNSPFSAISLVDQDGENPVLSYRTVDSSIRPNAPLIEEFLRAQFKALSMTAPNTDGSLHQVEVSGEVLPGYSMSFVPIRAQQSSEWKTRGWLGVGYQRPIRPDEETLLVASAQRLSDLAEIEYLGSEIQMRSQFLSIASHELKTPLTAIYGMLQLQERSLRLKRDDPNFKDPERQQQYLRRLLRQVERLNELIDGLLDISRIQNNRFMVEPSDTDVAVLLRETISSRIEQIAREGNVSLHVEAPNSLIAWVDPVRMEELVTNLTMNAIRFSPEGGVVWIRLKTDGDSFRFSVRDQGPSVPIEDRERIFRPFERAQRTARFGGMGLGLFISRQIAQLHGGNVTLVESVPGKGNVFEATFPIRAVSLVSA